jgi:hypothetical protein
MNNPLQTLEDYELFLYTLTSLFPCVRNSTLVSVQTGATRARVTGELTFEHGIVLIVREYLQIQNELPVTFHWYGYEVWQGEEKLYSYDPQPHPDDPTLASTQPHHKHIPPDIKHNRMPAPLMSFTRPNLPELIQEIEQLTIDEFYSS